MPIHDVEGSICNRIHELAIEGQVLNRKDHRCPCKTPKCRASIIYLPRSLRNYNQQSEAVIYFKDKRGKIQVASSSGDPTPAGWERCEAHTLGELRKIERHLTQEQYDIRSRFLEREQAASEEVIRENRRSLRSDMEHMSEKGRNFAREMMRRNDTRRSVYDKKVDPAVHFTITEFDDGKRR